MLANSFDLFLGNTGLMGKTKITDQKKKLIDKYRTDHTNGLMGKTKITDQAAYRHKVLRVLGKGSLRQVPKVFNYKKQEFAALKMTRNDKKFKRPGAQRT